MFGNIFGAAARVVSSKLSTTTAPTTPTSLTSSSDGGADSKDIEAMLENEDALGIAAALRSTPGDAPFHATCCKAVASLAWRVPVARALADADAAADVVAAVVAAAKADDGHPRTLKYACRALGRIAYHHAPRLASSLCGTVVATIVNAMTGHKEDARLQREACLAISNITVGGADAVAMAMRYGVVEVVIQAMHMHGGDRGVQEHGCSVLVNITAAGRDNTAAVVARGGAAALVGSMREHPCDVLVQERACCALGNVTLHCSNEVAGEMLDCGIVEILISAMKNHSDSDSLHLPACQTLKNLTRFPSTSARAFEKGAMIAIFNSIQLHKGVEESAHAAVANLFGAMDAKSEVKKTIVTRVLQLCSELMGCPQSSASITTTTTTTTRSDQSLRCSSGGSEPPGTGDLPENKVTAAMTDQKIPSDMNGPKEPSIGTEKLLRDKLLKAKVHQLEEEVERLTSANSSLVKELENTRQQTEASQAQKRSRSVSPMIVPQETAVDTELVPLARQVFSAGLKDIEPFPSQENSSSGVLVTKQRVYARKLLKTLCPSNFELFLRDMEVISELRHPNILQCFGLSSLTSNIVMVYEPVGCSLKFILQKQSLAVVEVKCLALGIAKGMEALHKLKIMHGELNSRSVMLDQWGNPKICDFGLSIFASGSTPNQEEFAYLSPQMLACSYGILADAWQFAVLVCEMLAGRVPQATPISLDSEIASFPPKSKQEIQKILQEDRLKMGVVECLTRRKACLKLLSETVEAQSNPTITDVFTHSIALCFAIPEEDRIPFCTLVQLLNVCHTTPTAGVTTVVTVHTPSSVTTLLDTTRPQPSCLCLTRILPFIPKN
ncbi:Protein kinase domain [Pelomyxa schiedti]|nr:Protein kinase domain [Pelomyxa schiedti]